MSTKSEKYLSAFIIIVNLLLVVFLFDHENVLLFTLLIPGVFWLISITGFVTSADYISATIVNFTSLISVTALGIYVFFLTDNVRRYWFFGWFLIFTSIFIDAVFRFRYYLGNEFFFFVIQSILISSALYLLTSTLYIPWNVAWPAIVPVLVYFVIVFFETFSGYDFDSQILVKSIIAVIACLCTGYIAFFADVELGYACVVDTDCQHGSSKTGTGEFVTGQCYCIDSNWFKSMPFGICLPCSMAVSTGRDCCGNALTYSNIHHLTCLPGAQKKNISCIS